MTHGHNSVSSLRVCLKCSKIKGAKSCIKVYSCYVLKIIQGNWAILVPKMTCHHNWVCFNNFFLEILHNETCSEAHENYINGFSEKIIL